MGNRLTHFQGCFIGVEALSSRLMSAFPSRADHKRGAGGLVEMERELTRLLIEYDNL